MPNSSRDAYPSSQVTSITSRSRLLPVFLEPELFAVVVATSLTVHMASACLSRKQLANHGQYPCRHLCRQDQGPGGPSHPSSSVHIHRLSRLLCSIALVPILHLPMAIQRSLMAENIVPIHSDCRPRHAPPVCGTSTHERRRGLELSSPCRWVPSSSCFPASPLCCLLDQHPPSLPRELSWRDAQPIDLPPLSTPSRTEVPRNGHCAT